MLVQILAGVILFTLIVLSLVVVIMVARFYLVPRGDVSIVINGDSENALSVPTGGKLLGTLAGAKIFLPSACGGQGTCAQCKVAVLSGGGDILPTEVDYMTRREVREGIRLGCQVPVKQNMEIEVPAEIFEVKKWQCKVRSNENVATFIKELVLELPEGEDVNFKAGGYIQIECPPHELSYRDFAIQPEYQEDWDKYDVWQYHSKVTEHVTRAYSMASYPAEKGLIKLNVRVATPPARSAERASRHHVVVYFQPEAG